MKITSANLRTLNEKQLADFLLYCTEAAFAAAHMPRFWAMKSKNKFSVFIKLLMIEISERCSMDKNNFLNFLKTINEAAEERISKFNPQELQAVREKALKHFDQNIKIETTSKKTRERLVESWMNVALLKIAYDINTEPVHTNEEKTAFLLSCNDYSNALKLIENKADEYAGLVSEIQP
ncbi:MAG: hypothetical protein LBQ86_04205 [Holophagales bacterium]|jgi:hypothetical protein|nr:hypothetical protein [Holophagales bacterium]